MVFYQPPKRQPRVRQPNDQATIIDLPDELLLQIIDGLPWQTILNLRRAHRHMTPVCNTFITKRLKRLYIHPSTMSLRAAVEICHHPSFNEEIDEVVLLGRVDWQAIGKEWPTYRTESEAVSVKKKYPGWKGKFKPWPLTYPQAAGKGAGRPASSLGQQAHDKSVPFDAAYAPLLDGLKMLPKLKNLFFTESCSKPGFNMVKESKIVSHAKLAATTDRIVARADAEVVFALLSHPGLGFTELALGGGELPFPPRMLSLPTSSASTMGYEALAGLTSIQLQFDQGWELSKWHICCGNLLAHAGQLQHLRLDWRANAYKQQSVCDECAAHYVLSSPLKPGKEYLRWPNLKSFVLTSIPTTSCHPSRPICHLFDMPAFIFAHAATLEHVEISNVTFAGYNSTTDTCESVDNMLSLTIGVLEECKQLFSVSWTIDRFGHHEQCKKKQNVLFDDCARKLGCGLYSGTFKQGSRLEDLELKVQEFEEYGVRSHTEGCWDFGEKVKAYLRDTGAWKGELPG